MLYAQQTLIAWKSGMELQRRTKSSDETLVFLILSPIYHSLTTGSGRCSSLRSLATCASVGAVSKCLRTGGPLKPDFGLSGAVRQRAKPRTKEKVGLWVEFVSRRTVSSNLVA